MTGFRATGRTCAKSKREKNSKFKLPLNARSIDKVQYFNDTFINALKFHFFAHDLAVPYPVARRILYDIWLDALRNGNDKIHKRNLENEFRNYIEYFDTHLTKYHDYIKEWEAYKKSEMYQETMQALKEIHRTDHRLSVATDFALAYIYAKYQKRYDYSRLIEKVETALHLDVIPKVWSKTSFWLAMQLLVFDANNLYANTIGNNRVYISQYDPITNDAIKIYITPWYEQSKYIQDEFIRGLATFYHHVVIPLAGEVGSVSLAEAARRGTVISLLHLSKAVLTLATLHPALRGIQTISKVFEFASVFLEKSILAWVGWQIAVEWSLDGAIQHFLSEFAKIIYEAFTGTPIRKSDLTHHEYRELQEALNLYFKLLDGSGYIDGSDVKLAEWYNNASLKLKQMFDKLIQTINIKEKMYNLMKETRLKRSEKEEMLSKSFTYVCVQDSNSFVKMLNNMTSTYFDKFEKALEAYSLNKESQDFSPLFYAYYNKAKKFIVDHNYSSLYERAIQDKELFADTYCQENFIKTPTDQIDLRVKAWVSNEYISTGLYLTSIGMNYAFTHHYNASLYYYNAIGLAFEIYIYDYQRGDISLDLFKLITECSNFDNIKSALDAVDPHIYVAPQTEDYKEITKFRSTDKLKLRKTNRCVSVVKKVYRKKSKENLRKYFPNSLTYHKSSRVISQYGIVIEKREGYEWKGSSASGGITAAISSDLESNIYRFSMYQSIIYPRIAFVPYAVPCDQKNPTGAIPFTVFLPFIDNEIAKSYTKYFFMIYNQNKTEVQRKKSKRSKIICIKKT
jgi:hypothetical protein